MMRRNLLFLGVAACASAGLAAVTLVATKRPTAIPLDPERVDLSALDQVPAETWTRLRAIRIYFGHQSVGSDVIAGVQWILQRKSYIGLRVVAASDAGAFDSPGLIHGPIGANGDPGSKMKEFAAAVRGPNGAGLDIALMKFCYVDMGSKSNPEQVVRDYRSMVDSITRDRPGLQIVHSTMPLTSLEVGRKALIKRALGRASAAELDNVQRETYNEALRTAFPRTAIFDLAAAETSVPGIEPAFLTRDGREWATLATELTTDGGHLNPGGQVLAARELLLALARQT